MRGNVFFQILEILKNKQPKYVLLENVRNLISHDKGKTFKFGMTSSSANPSPGKISVAFYGDNTYIARSKSTTVKVK